MDSPEKKSLSHFLFSKETEGKRLWTTVTKKDIQNHKQGIDIRAGKLSKSQDTIENRIFTISGQDLFYKKQKKTASIPKATFSLKWALVEFFELQETQFSDESSEMSEKIQEYSYLIKLNKSSKFTQIFVESIEEVNLWRSLLRKTGVFFNDFHNKYTILNILAESTYGNVRFKRLKFKIFYLLFN